MDYAGIYARLMDRAKQRDLVGYCERHHIIPRCLARIDGRSNVVRLTPEEHYIAHQLLVKMYPRHLGLTWAAVAMTNGTKRLPRRNKLYGWLRRRLAERLSEKFKGHGVSEETREKMRAAKVGRKRTPHSPETRAKMAAASKGRKKSAAHRAALSAAKTGISRGPHSELHRQRLSNSLRASKKHKDAVSSFVMTPEYRAKQSAITTAIWARRRAEEASRTSVI